MRLIIIFLILILIAPLASAVDITINDDRTVSVNGNKTFMIGMVAICTEAFQGGAIKPDCASDLNVNDNSMVDPMPNGQNSNNYTYSKASKFDVHNMYYGMRGWESRNTTVEALPGFWGYMQVDEPTIDDGTQTHYSIGYTQAQMLADLTAKYNDKKYSVTGHPMWLNICCKYSTGSGFDLVQAQQYADIVSFDKYGFTNEPWMDWTYLDGNYVWETYLAQDVLPGVTTDFEDAAFTKPVWSYVQAFGVNRTYKPVAITKTMARSVIWMQITSGIDGILFYAWLSEGDWSDANTSTGMWRNQTLGAQYNDLVGEVRSMNDILVAPMVSHQWFQHQSSDVTFGTTINKVVHYQNVNNWNYMRKEVGGKTYLVVVNKDAASVSNVQMTLSGLSGITDAKMLGDETSGSASEHKVTPLTVTNGVFTDSFDGFAVHIYEITDYSDDTIPGTPTEISATSGATWINTSWVAGYPGSITDSFNVSVNGAWANNTIPFRNTTLSSGQWQNVTVWAWNSTGAGNLSSSSASLNTQMSAESTESSQGYWFNDTGTYNVTVYGTNADGTTQTITWVVTVENEPEPPIESWNFGIGGQYFQNKTIGRNNTCINQGDGSLGVCSPDTATDNFNDNNIIGWNTSTIAGGTVFSSSNKTLNANNNGWAYLNQNVSSYENKAIFTEVTQYGNLNSTFDASDLRGNLSRGTDASTKMVQFSLSAGVNRTNISVGDAWTMIASGTKPMFVGQKLYTVFMVNGSTYRAYISNVSTADALANSLLTGTSSTWLNGTTIQLGAYVAPSSTVSWDNIRTVNLDALGNQYLQGNYSMNYTVPASQYAKNITINGTYPSGTNYSFKYRQNATGNYVAVEGIKTANSTIELPTPYYQNIDMILEMNSTESDTLWIQQVTIGASETDGTSAGTYIPPAPTNIISVPNLILGSNFSWQSGTGNITDSYNITWRCYNSSWVLQNQIVNYNINNNYYDNSCGSPGSIHGYLNMSVYAYNNSGIGTLNTTYIFNSTSLLNRVPTLSNTTNQTVNEGVIVFINIDGSDADSDTLTFSNSRTDLFTDFSSSTGQGNWTTNYSSFGITYLDIGVTDGYGGQTNYTMQITVNDVDTNTTPLISNVVNGSVNDTWGIVNFTINQSDALTNVKYSINSNLSSSSSTTNQTTLLNRSVNITGLDNGTKYYYSVFAYNYSNNSLWSNSTIQNFTTISNYTAPTYPNITSWQNNKTLNSTLNFTLNISESVNFNATANQTITTWNWYKDNINQNINYNNTTINWSSSGAKTIKVNATNINGTSNTIQWNVTINTLGQVIGLSNTTPTDTTVNIIWTSLTGANYYQVYKNGIHLAYTQNNYYNVTSLSVSTQYNFFVRGNDTDNNFGPNSTNISINTTTTTPAAPPSSGGGGGSTTVTPKPTTNIQDTTTEYNETYTLLETYNTKQPLLLSIYKITALPECSSLTKLSKANDKITISSGCMFTDISIDFILPSPYYEVYQLNGETIKIPQKITGKSTKEDFYIVTATPNSIGTFIIAEKPILDRTQIFLISLIDSFNSLIQAFISTISPYIQL